MRASTAWVIALLVIVFFTGLWIGRSSGSSGPSEAEIRQEVQREEHAKAQKFIDDLLLKMQPKVSSPIEANLENWPGIEYEVPVGAAATLWAPLDNRPGHRQLYALIITPPSGGCRVRVPDHQKIGRLPLIQSMDSPSQEKK